MRYIVYLVMFALVACSGEPVGKVSAAEAVSVVQQAESSFPGVNTSDAIGGVLNVVRTRGGSVKIIGWSQDYKSGGTHDVWFKVKTDGELSEFHWKINPDGTIIPINSLARNISKPITAK